MSYPTVTDAVTIGRQGELIAEAALIKYSPCRVTQIGFDLIIFQENTPFRVEVKSASKSADGAGHRYSFMTSSGSKSKKIVSSDQTDLVCLVALDIRKCVIMPASDIVKLKTTIRAEQFDIDESLQIVEALEKVRNAKC